jgi:hypothetical protein
MNSFSGSSLQRAQAGASRPSQLDMLNKDRDQGPGSSAFKTRQIADPGSLAISQRPATKVGRSSMDPTRLAEQAFRRTRDPMQRLQLGMIRSNLMGPQEDELDTLSAQSQQAGAPPPPTTGIPPQGGYLGNTSTAGTNAVTNSFMGNKNPALSGFRMPRSMFGMATAPFRVLGGLFNNSNQNR